MQVINIDTIGIQLLQTDIDLLQELVPAVRSRSHRIPLGSQSQFTFLPSSLSGELFLLSGTIHSSGVYLRVATRLEDVKDVLVFVYRVDFGMLRP
jgi:hypothetical protein